MRWSCRLSVRKPITTNTNTHFKYKYKRKYKFWSWRDDHVDSVCGNQLLQICHNLLISHHRCQSEQKCEKQQNRNRTKQGASEDGSMQFIANLLFCCHWSAGQACQESKSVKVSCQLWNATSCCQFDDYGKGWRAVNVVWKQKMRNGRREK